MPQNSFVLAGYDTLTSVLTRFMNSKDFDNHFTPEHICNYFNMTTNKFLVSYGQNFTKRKRNKFNEKKANLLHESRKTGFFDGCELLLDSGAFQIAGGLLDKEESLMLYDSYYDFLVEYKDSYDRAFILDLPPGPDCKLFNTFEEVKRLNLESYIKATSLPEDIRDRIIYIHHFRTPKLWNICTDILNYDDMFSKFKHFATGGIVVSMIGDMTIPCIIYILPLIPILARAKKYGKKDITFHILGGSAYRDLLFYDLFKRVVKDKHDIDLKITYDSSVIYKALMIGRHMPVIDEKEILRKLDLRTPALDLRFNNFGEKNIDVFKRIIRDFSNRFGFKEANPEHIYDESSNTFSEETRAYLMLYMLALYSDVEELVKKKCDLLYPMYKAEEIDMFNREVEIFTRNLNSGKKTRKQTVKSFSILKSLDMLSDLDEDYCKYIVDTFLIRDEFTFLEKGNFITF